MSEDNLGTPPIRGRVDRLLDARLDATTDRR